MRVAVIGAGRWGRNHVRTFSLLGALAAVVDSDPDTRARVAHEYPTVAVHAGIEAVLDDNSIDGIVVATPAPTHHSVASQVLDAGKDVLVEKPLTLSTSEARALVSKAEDSGRILMVGHLLLYQPAIAWMRGLLASGELGRVVRIETERLNLGRVRREENVLWSFAPHDLSVILHLLGEPRLVGTRAVGQCALQPGIEDHVHAEFSFEGGVSAHIHCSWLWPEKVRRTTVIGTKGMVVYDEVAGRVTVFRRGAAASLETFDDGAYSPELENIEPLRRECEAFLEAMETRKTPPSDGRNGLAVVELLEAATEALYG